MGGSMGGGPGGGSRGGHTSFFQIFKILIFEIERREVVE